MGRQIPRVLSEALTAKVWRDPGPDLLRAFLGHELDLSDLELFEDLEMMHNVSGQLDEAGYVDDPEFCMVREESDLAATGDGRLVFRSALFIGGSKMPGDDEFIALALRDGDDDPRVMVLDWRKQAPDRWVAVGPLSDLIARLSEHTDMGRG